VVPALPLLVADIVDGTYVLTGDAQQSDGWFDLGRFAVITGANAGLLAVQILAIGDPGLAKALEAYRAELHGQVRVKDERLQALGAQAYLEQMG
jgi:5-(carboxyamino)imidazole ribonucleotide mutase